MRPSPRASSVVEPTLRTARLILRPPEPGDLAWILESMNTPAVMRFLGGEVRSREEVEASFAADLEAFSSGGHRRWTVWLRDEEQRIGRCGLFHVRTQSAPTELVGQNEIGWTLAEAYWGRGFATEMAGAVLDFAFGPDGLRTVFSQTSDSNGPSTRLMQRLGFARRAELDYVDPDYPARDNPTTVWSLEAAEWTKNG